MLSYALLANVCICIQEEDEVPDDETVNQMIARSEEEFDQFMVGVVLKASRSPELQLVISHIETFLPPAPSAYGPGPAPRGSP